MVAGLAATAFTVTLAGTLRAGDAATVVDRGLSVNGGRTAGDAGTKVDRGFAFDDETTTVPDVFALVDAAFVVSGAALATGTAGPTAELAFVA